jgi:protein-L-isoaspartate(D-aspartate) O-methyltransferase
MQFLISELVADGYLKTPAIINAFYKINRKDFLTDEMADEAPVNSPLPIGHGQTNSQPLTVALMLELLQPQSGQKILDIGSGSGWTSALLAEIIGPKGKVFGLERIAELKEFGQTNAAKYKFLNIDFFCRDGSKGLPDQAPFDRILVSAAGLEIPQALKNQLKIGGRLVIPTVSEDIRLVEKVGKDKYKETVYPGFIFVPLIEE